MSNLKCFPKSKTSCPLKPWLVDFIFNYVSSHNVTANAVKIIENINEDENGNMMKLVTDGNVHIKANLTHQSIQTCIQENDDDMPPWDKALILMRKYSLSFQPKTELENCEFILIVDEFKLWDLQTGFDFKKTLHPCCNIAKVKMKIRENWQSWRQSVIPVNDEPSSIGDSMGSQLLSLLAEMGQETQPEDSQPDQLPSVVDDDPASKSEATSSMCSTDIPPVITGPTLITDNPSLSDSLKQPFLQYIDNKDHLYILHETPESQSQQYEEYEFSSPSEVSLEFSCESSDDNSTENKMAPKPSRNDSTSQNIRQEIKSPVCIEDDSDIPTNSCILTGDKPEICENVENNVEACGNDTDTEREENPNASENNNKQAFCGSENSSNLFESDRTLAKSNSGCNSGQLNSKDFLQSYVKYLKACSTSFNPSNTKQCNIGKSKTVNSKADVLINGSIDNDHEKSTLIETNQDNVDKSLPESSESQIYTSLVENDYDSIQWWSSAEDNSCLSSEEQDKPQECEKISEDGIITESDKNQTHKTSKCDKTSKQNKRVKRNETTGENCKSDLEKISDCTSELEDKSTPERDRIKESEFNSSDTLTDVEDNVSGTQPFSMNSSVEILESIGDTTCVGLKYKRNVSEKRENENDNELSGMQPLVSQPERNSDSISTREPSDEILNSNSNNSCEIIYKSSSSCYEISEFESKNSSDSIKNIVKPVICDAQKSGNSSIIYQSTQKTASKKEMPLFPLSPIKNPKQPSTSKDKAKDSVESLVFDTEYEEELRLRELAKADPKTNLKSKDKSTSKFGNSSYNLPASGKALNELGMKEKVIQNEHADKSDKSDQEKLSKTTVFNSDKASNSDLFLIKAAQSAEKGFPLKITENSNSTKCQTLQTSVTVNPSPSEKISSKPLNFQTQKVISDKDPEIVHPLEENHVEKSVPESNSKLSESVIIIVSSESISSNSEESRYSQNVVSFCTSPSKKCPSQVAKRKTKANVLAMDTEPNIIDESQDIPTSEVNNSILNRTTLCKTSTSSALQSDHSIINLSDLSDTSSEEREEPNKQTNQQLKHVLYERLRKRKRKLSMGRTSSVEIGEPSSKRKRCVQEQKDVCVDVHVPQNGNVSKQKTVSLVTESRRPTSQTLASTCDKGISIEKTKDMTPSATKSGANSDKSFNLKNQSVQTDKCKHALSNNNDQLRTSSSRSNFIVDQPRSSTSKSDLNVDQPRSSSSKSNTEINQPRSSSSRSNTEINQPRSSSSRSNMVNDLPRSSKSKSNMEVDQPRSSISKSNLIVGPPRSNSSRSNIKIDQPRSSSSRSNMVSDQPRSSSSRSNMEVDQPGSSSSKSIMEVDQPRTSSSRSNKEIDQPRSSSSKSIMEVDQPRTSSSRSNKEIDQPRPSSSRSNKEIDQPRPSSSRANMVNDQPRSSSSKSIMEVDQPRSSSSRSIMEVDQPRTISSRSNKEIDQPRPSSSRSNMVNDQPRSSSNNNNKEMSEDRNWWEISNQSLHKPSSSKGARNDSRLPEHAMRNVPQYFEELFEEEPPSELQRKLLNFKILSDKFDSIHKYIHK